MIQQRWMIKNGQDHHLSIISVASQGMYFGLRL